MVPFRPIFERLGLQVSWDENTQTVSGKKDKWSVSLTINQQQAKVNGETKILPKAAQIMNGYTFVPLRFIGEATGRNVLWDNDTKTIDIVSTLRSQTNDMLYSNGLKYEGDLKGDMKEGKGTYTYNGAVWYVGDFKSNKMEGQGKQYDPDSPQSYYEGQFVNNLPHGQGKLVFNDGSYYLGEFKEGVREGLGKIYAKNGKLWYEGTYVNDEKEGAGKSYYLDGSLLYEGNYKGGRQHGFGKIYYKGQVTYDGEFYKGKKQGKGRMYNLKASLLYEGEFFNDVPHGFGKMYDEKGRLTYEGEFKYNNETGKGKMYYENGEVYEGEVYNNKPEGLGTLTDASGKVISSGYFENGKYKAPGLDEKDEQYNIVRLKKAFQQKVIDGISSNPYGLKITEAIMFLELPTKDSLNQFQQLSEYSKKQLINSYVQEHWRSVLGVKHCYAKVIFQNTIYAEADISHQMFNDAVNLEVHAK
nr:stalk domain-containing protein [Paenibacillus hamazuiensis]